MTTRADLYRPMCEYYANISGLGWYRIYRQVEAESSFDRWAISEDGAKGLMQFTDATWGDVWKGVKHPRPPDPFDPEDSISAGCRQMRTLYEAYAEIPDTDERYRNALASYNCGRANWNRTLEEARRAEGAPVKYDDWKAAGCPRGMWQTFGRASRYLVMVIGSDAQQTIGYVSRIMDEDPYGFLRKKAPA